jgi:lipopolysaccharide/colanic/teichoic acid biosynthesis glycosyltransferase
VAERIETIAQPHEYSLVGYFPLTPGGTISLRNGSVLPNLGDVTNLENVLIHEAIQRIIMILPDDDTSWLGGAIKTCDYFRVTADVVPGAVLAATLDDLVVQTSWTPGQIPALTLAPPEAESEWLYLKRVLDVCVSLLLLVLLAPIFLIIAVAIKLTTPGLTVFYPWRVVGYRGRRFTGYKFTTMVADADDRKDELSALNEMSGPVFKIAQDPRVTPLGKFLRKYSLNELPQLWSVLRGDMSLVGPRPAGPHELIRYELWQKRKLSAQPGITCFWQVRGRNRISNFDDWVRMDLEYIRDRSLWLDCKILAKTAWVVVRGTGS